MNHSVDQREKTRPREELGTDGLVSCFALMNGGFPQPGMVLPGRGKPRFACNCSFRERGVVLVPTVSDRERPRFFATKYGIVTAS